MPGAQAVQERAGLLQAETEVLEDADLFHQPQVGVPVHPVAVAGPAGREQSAGFVVPQGAGADPPRAASSLMRMPATLDLDAGVRARTWTGLTFRLLESPA
ncbi:hypothetical protein GCM10009757_24950 [Streptomyces cheonanensis]|uniref:Uncharacterized protein n=1 Tax=Streptomyces cheonanensis TaxID=312720 RepID=A0ABN2V4S4_9ACTN